MNYTGFLRRFGAYVIDALILWIPSLFVGGGIQSIPSALGLGLVFGLLYYPVFESSAMCSTPGKALMNIVVLSESGDRLTFKAAVVRYLCRYISSAIACIGYLMQLFTSKRQTLHDMLSEAVVVDREIPDVNYFTVWKDQFKAVVGKL